MPAPGRKSTVQSQVTGHHNQTNSEQFLFFYMADATHGEFCQWFPSTFTITKSEILSLLGHARENTDVDVETETKPKNETTIKDTITFTCAEQFMMYCKALRFHDSATAALILSTSSPKEQKLLGKSVANFTDATWDEVKSAVVLAGTMAKFRQNAKLKGKLLATGEKVLAEAASRDRVWGIGYTAKHALAFQQHWGENRLGKALMEVRKNLRMEDVGRNYGVTENLG